MSKRRIFGGLAASAALSGSLLLAGAPRVSAQVVDCRSWQPSTAACGELFFNKTPENEAAAPGTALTVRPPAVPSHSTAVVIGEPGRAPSTAGGGGAGGGGVGGSAVPETAPGAVPSSAAGVAAPQQAPNLAGPSAGPSAAAPGQALPAATGGAGAATGTGVAGAGIATPATNVNTPSEGVTSTGVGSVGPLQPTTGITTGASTSTPAAPTAPAPGGSNQPALTAPTGPNQPALTAPTGPNQPTATTSAEACVPSREDARSATAGGEPTASRPVAPGVAPQVDGGTVAQCEAPAEPSTGGAGTPPTSR